jgi:3-oxoacyl-[acyl-carrier protein] reductase
VSSELKGKVALVTGASRGLGEGAARALAHAGAKVMLVARDGALAGKVARDIGGEATGCDVSDYAAVQKVVAETKARLGRLDIR